jgi:hypothetical protein
MVRRLLARMTGREQTARLDALERTIRKLADAQREHAAVQQAALAALTARQQQQSTTREVKEAVDAVRALGHVVDRTIEELLGRGGPIERQRLDEKRVRRRLEQIADSNDPIVVGPWTGEVGFELLYWIPFVAWACAEWNISPTRLTIVSRGGTGGWYGMPDAQYADVFSFFTPDAFRNATAAAKKKQRRVATFDRAVLEAVRAEYHLERVELLHPGLMYRLFMPFWRDEAPISRVGRFSRHRAFAPQDEPALDGLPAEYIAARFYFNDCFLDTDANRAFVRSVLSSLATRMPVVLLAPGLTFDDHVDCVPDCRDRMFTIASAEPDSNLRTQSAVISRARAFVGTYGGYSYLAPFYGVPALGFYSTRAFKLQHLHSAQWIFNQLGGATVTPIDVAHAPLVRFMLGDLISAAS